MHSMKQYDTQPANLASSSDFIHVNRLESGNDEKGGVFTSKPVYNYDSVKNAQLAEHVSEAAFMTN